MIEDILIGLTHRMGYHLVFNASSVDEEVLQICLTAGKCRQANPAPESYPATLVINIQSLLHKGSTADIRDALFFFLNSFCRQ